MTFAGIDGFEHYLSYVGASKRRASLFQRMIQHARGIVITYSGGKE